MAAYEHQAFSAIAFQLAATLEAYEQDVAGLLRVKGSPDPELYRRISGHIDRMRMYAASLPPVSVAWVEVLIRHFELMHGLWRAQHDPAQHDTLAASREQLTASVRRLSRCCVQLMPAA
jgi:hypothetical protein